MSQLPSHTRDRNRSEPTLRSVAALAGLLLILVAALGIMIIKQPFASGVLTLLSMAALLAGIATAGYVLMRERITPPESTSQ